MVAKSLSWGGQLSNMVHMPLELAGQQKQKLTIQFNVKVITRYCSPPRCGKSSGFSCIGLIHCLTSCFLKKGDCFLQLESPPLWEALKCAGQCTGYLAPPPHSVWQISSDEQLVTSDYLQPNQVDTVQKGAAFFQNQFSIAKGFLMKKVANLDFSFLCGADRQGNLWIEYNPQFSLEPTLTHCSNQDFS